MVLATAGPSALWYLTRATGAVTLVLLTVSMVLGVANVGRLQSPGWPRFVIEGVHRNVSLLAIAVLAVHIATSVLDPFAGVHLLDAFVPFVGTYRPFWLGLGAFAFDLLLAIAITSMVRRRLGHRAWRATHWLAYLCWPVAVMHTVGTGSDVKQFWLLALTAVCVLSVIVAVLARIGFGWPDRRGLRSGAVAASIALPVALVVWLPSGPLGSNWAARSGTPASALPKATGTSTSTSQSSGSGQGPVSAFSASVLGTVAESQSGGGTATVNISLTVGNAVLSTMAIQINGTSEAGGGVAMTSSSVSLGSASNPQQFTGAVTSLDGSAINARVASADGQSLALAIDLQIASNGTASGSVEAAPA
jgi:DMSO/TMAO reductase YedYZ heme-binding membrane subunit